MKVFIVHPYDYGGDSAWSTKELAQARLEALAQKSWAQRAEWQKLPDYDPETDPTPTIEELRKNWYIAEFEVDPPVYSLQDVTY